jgi:hypothetical protein
MIARSFLLSSFMALCALSVFDSAGSEDPDAGFVPVQGVSIRGQVLTEIGCELLVTTSSGASELRQIPGMHVLGRERVDPLIPPSTSDLKVSAVSCWRSAARFASNDYLVPHVTGYPLFIKTYMGDQSPVRVNVLEKAGGSLRIRLVQGSDWTPTEESEMKEAIELFIKLANSDA